MERDVEIIRLRHDIDRLNELVRANLARLGAQVAEVQARTEKVESEVKLKDNFGVTNLIFNSDASFSTLNYQTTPANDNVLAHWYRITSTSTAQITENGALVSADAITTTSSPSSWQKTNGTVKWAGTDSILLPIHKRLFIPGEEFYVSFFVKGNNLSPTESNPINPLNKDLTLAAAFRVNTNPTEYMRGSPVSGVTLTITGTIGGAFSRTYIIEALFPGGGRASSASVSTGAIGFDTTPSASNYVDVRWNEVLGATQINVYRLAGTTWKLLASLPGNFTHYRDAGDVLATTVPAPTAGLFETVRAVSNPLRDGLTGDFNLISFRLRIPFTLVFPTAKVFLRLEASHDLGANGLSIDRVLVSTSVGRWVAAPQDMGVSGDVSISAPTPIAPPVIINPGIGGGYIGEKEFM